MGVPIALGYKEDDASGAQVIDGGLRFDSGKSQRLVRTPSSTGNRKTFTLSLWTKRNALGGAGQPSILAVPVGSNDNDYFQFGFYQDNLYMFGYSTLFRITSPKYRDISGWYHLVFAADTTQTDNNDRMKFYVNGIRVTDFSTNNTITQYADLGVNRTAVHNIGIQDTSYPYDGHMSQFYLIDGQALDPSYFGYTDPLTNTWRPKKYKPAATPNNGTTWSSYLTTNAGSNFDGSYPVTNAFDNSSTTKCLTANNANGTTTGTSYIQFNSPSSFSGTLKVICDNGNAVYNLTSGSPVLLATQSTGLDDQLLDCGTVTGISSIRVLMSGGSRPAIGAIYINGVGLIDSLNDTGGVGTNGFYLPLDGSTPIGQDQSGRGNNWTPVNFGGSNTIEKATGALPILNTDGGGKVARVGVRTDTAVGAGVTCVLALPLVGIKSDFSNQVDSRSSNKTVTLTSAVGVSTQSNFYGGSYLLGNGKYLDVTGISVSTNEDYTIEFWIKLVSASNYATIHPGSGYWGNLEFYWSIQNVNSSDGQSVLNKWRVEDGAGGMDSNNVKTDYDESASVATSWNHIAFVRSSGNCYLYYNGRRQTLHGATTDTSAKSGTLRIGHTSNGEYYLSDYRFYTGVAKYTQNFIPASTDPDILPDTPSGVAYSSNVALVPSTDGGGVAFDGSNSNLSVGGTLSDFALSGNFTIECFLYLNPGATSDRYLLDYRSDGPTGQNTYIYFNDAGNGGFRFNMGGVGEATSATFTAPKGLWHHFALVRSGSTITAYINGISVLTQTNSSSVSAPGTSLKIGSAWNSSTQPWDGFVSNFHVVNGTALYTSNFTPPTGPITSVANTKLLCCKSNSSATAFDVSPGTITANGNAVATNFNPFTVNINTQRGQESGYCTLNPLTSPGTNYITLSNGNLDQVALTETVSSTKGTVGVTTGKWYWECNLKLLSSGGVSPRIGICRQSAPSLSQANGADEWIIYMSDYSGYGGRGAHNSTLVGSDAPFANGDVGMFALDMNSSKIYFGKNGIWLNGGNPVNGSGAFFTDVTGEIFPLTNTGYYSSVSMNFGQKPFKFPPPAGFQPLALANTPRPTIVRPDQYVGVSTWSGAQSGSGGLTRQISTGFQPDFVWIKQRNQAFSTGHQLYDSVRGAGAEKELNSSGTAAEGAGNIETYGWLNSFDKTGFTVKGGSLDYDYVDKSGTNYVAWAWKAGGNSNTFNINDIGYSTASAAGLTAGTITPTGASVNTKSGFSIIGYTGTGANATISHGLGNAPSFIIIKKRTSSPGDTNWRVYHSALGNTKAIYLSSTGAADTSSVYWNNTSPTSSVFTLGSDDGLNASSQTHIAYLWAEIPGFSKFGSYTGNNSTDGVYVSLGFRPKFLIVKCIQDIAGDVEHWIIRDSTRSTYNPANANLYANLSNAEDDASGFSGSLDLLSNGFKMRGTYGGINASATYIYAAWAETPSFNLYGGQSNAR